VGGSMADSGGRLCYADWINHVRPLAPFTGSGDSRKASKTVATMNCAIVWGIAILTGSAAPLGDALCGRPR
jgi:hypothetical protein